MFPACNKKAVTTLQVGSTSAGEILCNKRQFVPQKSQPLIMEKESTLRKERKSPQHTHTHTHACNSHHIRLRFSGKSSRRVNGLPVLQHVISSGNCLSPQRTSSASHSLLLLLLSMMYFIFSCHCDYVFLISFHFPLLLFAAGFVAALRDAGGDGCGGRLPVPTAPSTLPLLPPDDCHVMSYRNVLRVNISQ